MGDEDELAQAAVELLIIFGHSKTPLFHIVQEIVDTLLWCKVQLEIVWPTGSAHTDIIKENEVEVLFQILNNERAQSR